MDAGLILFMGIGVLISLRISYLRYQLEMQKRRAEDWRDIAMKYRETALLYSQARWMKSAFDEIKEHELFHYYEYAGSDKSEEN